MMLDGKKTYMASIVAALVGGAVFLENHITWQELVSVCMVAAGFVVLRLALAGNRAATDRNTELLEQILKKK